MPAPAAADEPPPEDLALRALGNATAVAGALLGDSRAEITELVDGCYIWQQPGVALVATGIWHPADGDPELWLPSERLGDFLLAQRDLRLAEPFVFPSEPAEGADSLQIDPAVYLLGADEAQRRLQLYLNNLDTWLGLNPGMELIIPEDNARWPDCAVVFIDSSGPVEFYFKADDHGDLRLTHLIHYYFFSA
jgi:hypothetical protein